MAMTGARQVKSIMEPLTIDGRRMPIEEVLSLLRDEFRKNYTGVLNIEVLVTDRQKAAKVRTFCSMTGFEVQVHQAGDDYLITIKGESCRCV